MFHNFYYKKIGELKEDTLKYFQDYVLKLNYVSSKDFNSKVLNSSNIVNIDLFQKLINEMSLFFKPNGHIGTNIARMSPMSYIKEHSDYESTINIPSNFDNIIKIQIPVLTNKFVAMMWSTTHDMFVGTFDVGGIYIIDNIKRHSVVNFGDSYRYNITMRFDKCSICDKTLLN